MTGWISTWKGGEPMLPQMTLVILLVIAVELALIYVRLGKQ